MIWKLVRVKATRSIQLYSVILVASRRRKALLMLMTKYAVHSSFRAQPLLLLHVSWHGYCCCGLQSASTFHIGALLSRPHSDREAAEVGAFDFGDLADSKMIVQMMTKAAMIPQGPRSDLRRI